MQSFPPHFHTEVGSGISLQHACSALQMKYSRGLATAALHASVWILLQLNSLRTLIAHVTIPAMPQVFWAFCVYLEAVSVLPQLRMMQKAKVSG